MTRISLDRRRFLTALGLGAAGLGAASLGLPGTAGWASRAQAGGSTLPARVLFWITPHGTVWNAWNMSVPGLAPSGTSVAPLTGLDAGVWSRILSPLAPFASKLNIVEGLARLSGIDYERKYATTAGYDLNRHDFGQADLLTCVDAMQRSGAICTGGAASIDQVIGRASAQPGRWASRVYGSNQAMYSFVAPGELAPIVTDARQAYQDIMGLYEPPDTTGDPRAAAIMRARASALDFAARELDAVAPRLGTDDRMKLERHAALIRDLEVSFQGTAPGASCNPTGYSELGHLLDRFARVSALALSCDMTRVVTLVTPNLGVTEFGGPPEESDVHENIAHRSIRGRQPFSDYGEQWMVEYNVFYARRFAYLLEQLDSIPEGEGTLLDNTAVVWLTELGTGTHELVDTPIVIAGGAGGFFRTGQYVRYARENRVRQGWDETDAGPAQNRLYVTLMRAMGIDADQFGVESVPRVGGGTITLRGVLPELVA